MNAGDLDRRVTLQSASIVKDATGGPVETWADTATVWAAIYDLSGKAINEALQVGSAVNRRVTIRWRSGVTSAMRIKFVDGSTAKVAFVRELGRREFLELHCEDMNA
jgi:SPP1 family predicted phage head-tail adaptor